MELKIVFIVDDALGVFAFYHLVHILMGKLENERKAKFESRRNDYVYKGLKLLSMVL